MISKNNLLQINKLCFCMSPKKIISIFRTNEFWCFHILRPFCRTLENPSNCSALTAKEISCSMSERPKITFGLTSLELTLAVRVSVYRLLWRLVKHYWCGFSLVCSVLCFSVRCLLQRSKIRLHFVSLSGTILQHSFVFNKTFATLLIYLTPV